MTAAVTPGRAKVLNDLAGDLEVARDAYLSAMESQNPDAMADRREVLERLLWDDKGTIIDALRLAAKPADQGVRALLKAVKPFAELAPLVEFTDQRDGERVHEQKDPATGKYTVLYRKDFRRLKLAYDSLSTTGEPKR